MLANPASVNPSLVEPAMRLADISYRGGKLEYRSHYHTEPEWALRSFRIRNFPLPQDAVPQLVSRALGDSTRRTVPVRIPAGIREIRVRPSGATLFGNARP